MTKGLQLCTGDNLLAHSFLVALFQYFHQLDDFVDGDAVTLEQIMHVQMGLMHTLSFNPFWIENKNVLWPIIHDSIMQYWESEVLRGTGLAQNKIVGHVLKSGYQSVAFMVAFLTGGLDREMHARRELRYADFDD